MSWDTVSLGSVAEVFNGKTPSKAEKRSEGLPVLKIKDVDESGNFRGFDSFVEPAFHEKYSKKTVRAGDTLVLNAAHSATHVGSKICRAPEEAVGALATGEWLMVRCNTETDPRFVNHWMTSDLARRQIRDAVKGIHLYPKDVARFSIPLPPLEEQRRIAGILDAADALRRRRREALALLDTLPGAIFAGMFGDRSDLPSTKIEDVVVNSRTGPFGSQLLKAEFVESGIPVLGIDNVVTNHFIEETPRFITEQKYKSLQRYTVIPGDVLITIMGTCGRCAVVPTGIPTMVNTKHLCCLTPKHEEIHSEYLRAAFLFDDDVRRQLEQQTKGSIMSGLNMGIIKGLSIKLPSISEQESFAARLRNVDSQIGNCKTHSVELEALFASLQSRAFAGEL